jgi:predicted LPLAT superfamily acyltransferase
VKRGQLVDCRENVFWVLTSASRMARRHRLRRVRQSDREAQACSVGRRAAASGPRPTTRASACGSSSMGYSIKAMNNIMAAVMLAGDEARFHPVRALPARFEWDQPRVDAG